MDANNEILKEFWCGGVKSFGEEKKTGQGWFWFVWMGTSGLASWTKWLFINQVTNTSTISCIWNTEKRRRCTRVSKFKIRFSNWTFGKLFLCQNRFIRKLMLILKFIVLSLGCFRYFLKKKTKTVCRKMLQKFLWNCVFVILFPTWHASKCKSFGNKSMSIFEKFSCIRCDFNTNSVFISFSFPLFSLSSAFCSFFWVFFFLLFFIVFFATKIWQKR